MTKIVKYLKSLCTITGALFIIGGCLTLFIGWWNSDKIDILPHTILTIDMNHNYSEVPTDSIVDEVLGRESMSFEKLLKAIEFAAIDERIDLATFFDKIYMQPHTSIGLTGISIEIPFFKKLMQKIGIDAEFYTRYQYKTAMASFTDNTMSEPMREEMLNLSTNLMNEIKADIIHNRQLKQDIDELINKAPLSAEKGLEVGLVDELMYLPQLEEKLKEEGAENFVSVENYASQIYSNTGDIPTIAYLNLSGIINTGETSSDIDGEYMLGSQSVLADLAEIQDIDNLKALIIRIDSPGGSYNAADEIYFALKIKIFLL